VKKEFSHKTDVWSFGITLWEIFSFAEKPYQKEFKIRNPADVKEVLKKETVMSAPQNYFGDKEKEKKTYEKVKAIYEQVIKPCWNFTAERRPTFASLHDSLQNVDNTYEGDYFDEV